MTETTETTDTTVDENVEQEQQSAMTKKIERGGIPYARFKNVIEERNEYHATTIEQTTEIEKLKRDIGKKEEKIKELEKSEIELAEWKKKEFEKNKTAWDLKKKIFDAKEGDENFEKIQKVKHRFKFAENGKELASSEIAQNLAIIKTYEEIDYFENEKNSPGYNTAKPGGHSSEKYGGYKSIEEWSRHDPKSAGEWLEKNRS